MERLQQIGRIAPLHASRIKRSRMGIGFEKLDRNVFDPFKAYDKLAATGVKWVRIQSGWARTEKEKGVYDFSWLDSIVDELCARGLTPWVCLCYGNGLYTPEGNHYFGAVGCVPNNSEEALKAWQAYVYAIVSRYAGRISCWEVWNEPDGKWCWKKGTDGAEYGRFVVGTAKAVKQADPSARVFGGAIYGRDLKFTDDALAAGMSECIDALTFHEYTPTEVSLKERVDSLRALCHSYNPNIAIIQGESGSQSSSRGAGAMKGAAWTQRRQAKQLLRHGVADLLCGVQFTSYFSCMDMIEALNGVTGDKSSYLDYGYFGILGADFDENGFSSGEYTPKASYWALTNLCALMAEDPELVNLPVMMKKLPSPRLLGEDYYDLNMFRAGFRRENGSTALCYWHPADLLTTEFESTVSFQIAGQKGDIRLVDPMDGAVYRLPEGMIERQSDTCLLLSNLPIRDYPLFVTFGDFVGIEAGT